MASPPTFIFAFANDRGDNKRYLNRLDEERLRIEDALRSAEDRCKTVMRPNATPADVFRSCQVASGAGRLVLFHFAGHASAYKLWFEDTDARTRAVEARDLTEFLKGVGTLQLVFLNGCCTNQQARGLLDSGIPAVVATSSSLPDGSAVQFAELFYRAIAESASIKEAFLQASGGTRATHGERVRDAELGAAGAAPSSLWELHGDEAALTHRLLAPRPGDVEYTTIVLEATFEDMDGPTLARLTSELQQRAKDYRLKITKCKKGSVRLTVSASAAGVRELVRQWQAGELNRLGEFRVLHVVAGEVGDAEEVGISASPAKASRSRVDPEREEEVLDHVRNDRRDAALKLLMVTYGGVLASFLTRLVHDRDRAKGICQKVFLEVFEQIRAFEGHDRRSLWTWLCGIAYRRFLHELEETRSSFLMAPGDLERWLFGQTDSKTDDRRAAAHRALEQCLASLPVRMRAWVLMRFYLGLSYAEVAEIVGVEPATVKGSISRLQPRLRRCVYGNADERARA